MIASILFRTIASGASVVCPAGYSGTCSTGLPGVGATPAELQTVLQIVFGIAAVISVLFVVIGGFQFVLSQGSSENTNKARETIIYALVGLVISLSAESIVSFVLFRLKSV
jgi:hypothetical protein